MNNNYFYELKYTSSYFIDFYKKLKNIQWESYMGWFAFPLSKKIWIKEKLLEELNNKFKIKQAGFLKTTPFSCYHWHKDRNRGVCINSLITTDSKSLSLFGKYKNNHNSQLDFVELKYEENKFYLFNNQEYHTVINFDKDRVIFTVEFEKNKNELKYEDLLKYVKLGL